MTRSSASAEISQHPLILSSLKSSPGAIVSLNPHDPPPPAFAGHCVNGSQVPPGGWFPANLPEETVRHFGTWRDRGCRVLAATTGGTRNSQVGPPLRILPAFISSTIGSLGSVFHILEFFFRSLASPFQPEGSELGQVCQFLVPLPRESAAVPPL